MLDVLYVMLPGLNELLFVFSSLVAMAYIGGIYVLLSADLHNPAVRSYIIKTVETKALVWVWFVLDLALIALAYYYEQTAYVGVFSVFIVLTVLAHYIEHSDAVRQRYLKSLELWQAYSVVPN